MQTLVEFMNRDRLKKYKSNEKIVLELLDSDDTIELMSRSACTTEDIAAEILSFFKDKIERIGLDDFSKYIHSREAESELYKWIDKEKKNFNAGIIWGPRVPSMIICVQGIIEDYLD